MPDMTVIFFWVMQQQNSYATSTVANDNKTHPSCLAMLACSVGGMSMMARAWALLHRGKTLIYASFFFVLGNGPLKKKASLTNGPFVPENIFAASIHGRVDSRADTEYFHAP